MALDGIVVGGMVWIEGMRNGLRKRWAATVSKRTRTQIVAQYFFGTSLFEVRFRRADGVEIGGLHDVIVGLATSEEVAAWRVTRKAVAAREEILGAEEARLKSLVQALPNAAVLERNGEKYFLKIAGLTASQVRIVLAVLGR